MNLPEWAPSCSGASANSECPSYKKRLVVETQTTTSHIIHQVIPVKYNTHTFLAFGNRHFSKLLDNFSKKHNQTQDCLHHQQLASATFVSAADSPCVQRCWSSSRMVLCTSNIFPHLFGYSDLYDANYFPNIYSTRIPKRRKSGKGKMNSSNIGNIVTKPLSHSVVSLCC